MSTLIMHSFGEGTPLVICHGWGFDHHIWTSIRPELLALSRSYRLILIDLPGFGESPYMEWSEFKTALLKQLPEPFAVMGWSLGGLFATRLAIEAPERILQVINITSTPCFIRQALWPGIPRSVLHDFYERFQKTPVLTRQQFITLQAQMNSGHVMDHPINQKGLEAGLVMLREWDLRAQLSDIALPVAYIFGRLDTIVPVAVMASMQRKYPHFKYHVLDKAAHMPFLSHPKEFMDIVSSLLC